MHLVIGHSRTGGLSLIPVEGTRLQKLDTVTITNSLNTTLYGTPHPPYLISAHLQHQDKLEHFQVLLIISGEVMTMDYWVMY